MLTIYGKTIISPQVVPFSVSDRLTPLMVRYADPREGSCIMRPIQWLAVNVSGLAITGIAAIEIVVFGILALLTAPLILCKLDRPCGFLASQLGKSVITFLTVEITAFAFNIDLVEYIWHKLRGQEADSVRLRVDIIEGLNVASSAYGDHKLENELETRRQGAGNNADPQVEHLPLPNTAQPAQGEEKAKAEHLIALGEALVIGPDYFFIRSEYIPFVVMKAVYSYVYGIHRFDNYILPFSSNTISAIRRLRRNNNNLNADEIADLQNAVNDDLSFDQTFANSRIRAAYLALRNVGYPEMQSGSVFIQQCIPRAAVIGHTRIQADARVIQSRARVQARAQTLLQERRAQRNQRARPG